MWQTSQQHLDQEAPCPIKDFSPFWKAADVHLTSGGCFNLFSLSAWACRPLIFSFKVHGRGESSGVCLYVQSIRTISVWCDNRTLRWKPAITVMALKHPTYSIRLSNACLVWGVTQNLINPLGVMNMGVGHFPWLTLVPSLSALKCIFINFTKVLTLLMSLHSYFERNKNDL